MCSNQSAVAVGEALGSESPPLGFRKLAVTMRALSSLTTTIVLVASGRRCVPHEVSPRSAP